MNYAEQRISVGGTELYVLKGGSGRPLLVLHGIEGHEGWLAFHNALASSATVLAPSHPGYGHTPAPNWITGIWHQAVFYHWYLQAAGLSEVDLVGVDIGGWIAACMAVMDASRLRRLVLVGAAGIRPHDGEIFDVFVAEWPDVVLRSFYQPDESPEYQRIYASANLAEFGGVREAAKTMSIRMCFKPYMYDPALPGMLGKIRLPTLVVWGTDDRIIPLECGQLYQRLIPGAQLRTIERCGHWAHLDRPKELAEIIHDFLSAH